MRHESLLGSAEILERDEKTIGSAGKIRFYPIVVDRAIGATIIDADGREYLDFVAGWAVANTGYGHPVILEAIKRQLDKASFAFDGKLHK